MTVRIYTASKLYMADAWKTLREQCIDVEFTARWPDSPDLEKERLNKLGADDYERAWIEDHIDVSRADVVLCYGAAEDVLCGALIEAGMALGMGKTVICVGSSKSFGTWIHHENVYRAKTVMEAIELAKTLFN